MMSGYYDQHLRWEPLAEFHFNIDSDEDELFDEDNYVYCLCSRVCIREGVRRHVEKEEGSESDAEVLQDSQAHEWEDESHVHFSVDTSYKVKCEKDEGASCYCSASHTDNYWSADEHEPAPALQPSDSGADLTYPDCHSDHAGYHPDCHSDHAGYHPDCHSDHAGYHPDCHSDHAGYLLDKMDQDFVPTQTNENYLSENTWDKFWAVNGERLIWASWIQRYSDYINPSYLDENNELVMDEQNIPKEHSADPIFEKETDRFKKNLNEDDGMRDRKFSYDSKVNPYKKKKCSQPAEKNDKPSEGNGDDAWAPIGRRRSCSEHERMLSPRTIAGTDSMTNVTKITLSSYDVTSSHVTSESTPPDDCSVSSSTSDDQNDQTRIANVDDLDRPLSEEIDPDQYWQLLWKKHFGEQYALHYANYIESHNTPEPVIIETLPEKKTDLLDVEQNGEGNSRETPTIVEVQARVDQIKLEDKVSKSRRRSKKTSTRYLGSVGVLLQSLLKEEQRRIRDETPEVVEAAGGGETRNESNQSRDEPAGEADAVDGAPDPPVPDGNVRDHSDGGDEPPDERPLTLKRSHEVEEGSLARATLAAMGFRAAPGGRLVRRLRRARLRPPRPPRPRPRRPPAARKTYFDDDGNPYQMDQGQESGDSRELATDDEGPAASGEMRTDDEGPAASGEIRTDDEGPAASDAERDDAASSPERHAAGPGRARDPPGTGAEQPGAEAAAGAARRRGRRAGAGAGAGAAENTGAELPPELRGHEHMLKYWKKRHSLFHRFDEGVRLDYESWFSVTPERVARHVADKLRCDTLLDAFCGAGGNTLQFADTCNRVIAVDIDPEKIALARHNAAVYGVAGRVEFVVGDFFALAGSLKADAVFLSPPWGGPSYSESASYDVEASLEPRPASALLAAARRVSPRVALYLPRTARTDQLVSLAREAGASLELEQSFLDRRFVAITAYFC